MLTVYLVQPQPELSTWISKTLLIVTPVTIEVNRSIHSALEHCLPTTICGHITVCLECWLTVWLNVVDSIGCLTLSQGILAVSIHSMH